MRQILSANVSTIWIARDEHRNIIHKPQSCFERAASIKSGGLLRSRREVIDHHSAEEFFSSAMISSRVDSFSSGRNVKRICRSYGEDSVRTHPILQSRR
jgi:hypothetical protein